MNYSYQIYGYAGRHRTTWTTKVFYTYRAEDGTRQSDYVWYKGYSKKTKIEWKQTIEKNKNHVKVFVTEIKHIGYED